MNGPPSSFEELRRFFMHQYSGVPPARFPPPLGPPTGVGVPLPHYPPAAQLCWLETCPNSQLCSRYHISLNELIPPLLPQPVVPPPLPVPSMYLTQVTQSSGFQPLALSLPPVPPMDHLLRPQVMPGPSLDRPLSAHDSGHESYSQMDTESPTKSVSSHQHVQFPDDVGSSSGHSDVSSGYRSKSSSFSAQKSASGFSAPYKPRSVSFGEKYTSKSRHAILAGLLRREGRGGASSSGTSSRGSSPAAKSGFSSLRDLSSSADLIMDHDVDISSDGSGPSNSGDPRLLPQRPPVSGEIPFSVLKLLSSTGIESTSEGRRSADTPPYHGAFGPIDSVRFANQLPPGSRPSLSVAKNLDETIERVLSDSSLALGSESSLCLSTLSHPTSISFSQPSTSHGACFAPSSELDASGSTLLSPTLSDGSRSSLGSGVGSVPVTTVASSIAFASCSICEDRASGYHYGVISCEGCKGFFRRSVQKDCKYSCHRDENCVVNRITRNRCAACRFNKCLSVGMSKQSVRQDKNKKRKMKDEQEEEELRQTAELQRIIGAVVQAHNSTAKLLPADQQLRSLSDFVKEDLLAEGSKGLDEVIQFCRKVPGFEQLSSLDRDILLRYGCLEIWVLRCAFILCGRQIPMSSCQPGTAVNPSTSSGDVGLQSLVSCVSKLRDALTQLQVFNEEIALLSAICFMCHTRPGLQDPDLIESLQEPLLEGLRIQIHLRKVVISPDSATSAQQIAASPQTVLPKLLLKISDIRAVVVKDLENFCFIPPLQSSSVSALAMKKLS